MKADGNEREREREDRMFFLLFCFVLTAVRCR